VLVETFVRQSRERERKRDSEKNRVRVEKSCCHCCICHCCRCDCCWLPTENLEKRKGLQIFTFIHVFFVLCHEYTKNCTPHIFRIEEICCKNIQIFIVCTSLFVLEKICCRKVTNLHIIHVFIRVKQTCRENIWIFAVVTCFFVLIRFVVEKYELFICSTWLFILKKFAERDSYILRVFCTEKIVERDSYILRVFHTEKIWCEKTHTSYVFLVLKNLVRGRLRSPTQLSQKEIEEEKYTNNWDHNQKIHIEIIENKKKKKKRKTQKMNTNKRDLKQKICIRNKKQRKKNKKKEVEYEKTKLHSKNSYKKGESKERKTKKKKRFKKKKR